MEPLTPSRFLPNSPLETDPGIATSEHQHITKKTEEASKMLLNKTDKASVRIPIKKKIGKMDTAKTQDNLQAFKKLAVKSVLKLLHREEIESDAGITTESSYKEIQNYVNKSGTDPQKLICAVTDEIITNLSSTKNISSDELITVFTDIGAHQIEVSSGSENQAKFTHKQIQSTAAEIASNFEAFENIETSDIQAVLGDVFATMKRT